MQFPKSQMLWKRISHSKYKACYQAEKNDYTRNIRMIPQSNPTQPIARNRLQ